MGYLRKTIRACLLVLTAFMTLLAGTPRCFCDGHSDPATANRCCCAAAYEAHTPPCACCQGDNANDVREPGCSCGTTVPVLPAVPSNAPLRRGLDERGFSAVVVMSIAAPLAMAAQRSAPGASPSFFLPSERVIVFQHILI